MPDLTKKKKGKKMNDMNETAAFPIEQSNQQTELYQPSEVQKILLSEVLQTDQGIEAAYYLIQLRQLERTLYNMIEHSNPDDKFEDAIIKVEINKLSGLNLLILQKRLDPDFDNASNKLVRIIEKDSDNQIMKWVTQELREAQKLKKGEVQ